MFASAVGSGTGKPEIVLKTIIVDIVRCRVGIGSNRKSRGDFEKSFGKTIPKYRANGSDDATSDVRECSENKTVSRSEKKGKRLCC